MATEKRLISLDEALEATHKEVWWTESEASAIRSFLAKLPTADAVEVVHGRWVLMVHEEQCNFRWNVTAECSECQHSKGEIYAGHFSGFPKDIVESLLPIYAKKVKLDNYCPNCGAKMDVDGNG